MSLNCGNPKCPAKFLYLYEGEWIVIEVPGQTLQRYWLCGTCSQSMAVVYDPSESVKVVPKDMQKKTQEPKRVQP